MRTHALTSRNLPLIYINTGVIRVFFPQNEEDHHTAEGTVFYVREFWLFSIVDKYSNLVKSLTIAKAFSFKDQSQETSNIHATSLQIC